MINTVRCGDLAELAEGLRQAARQPGPVLVEADRDALDGGAPGAAEAIAQALGRAQSPAVLAVSGRVRGAGLAVALAFDAVVCAPSTTFAAGAAEEILDSGLAWSLVDRLGPGLARGVALAGRILDAVYARDIGLVIEVAADPVAHARTLAQEWAGTGEAALVRRALRAALRLDRAEADGFSRELAQILRQRETDRPG